MNKEYLNLLKNCINIKCNKSSSKYIQKLYKKKSAKIHLLFLNFFNSIFYFKKLLMLFNLNLFYFINMFYKKFKSIKNISFVNYYFINTNFNIYKINRKKILIKYRHIFVNQFRRFVSNIFIKTCKMVIKFNFGRRFKLWFTNVINKHLNIVNFNNIYLYCNEIYNCIFYFLYRISFIFFIKLKNLYKFFNNILIDQKINIKIFIYNFKKHKSLKYNKKNIIIILKFLKIFSHLIYNNHSKNLIKKEFFNIISQEYCAYMFYIKNKYVNKFLYLFDMYKNYNVKIKTYWNFSFFFKKNKNKNKTYYKKHFNFFYIINNLINKYIYFIFIHWVNLFFKECVSQLNFDDEKNYIKNNNKLPIATIYKLYYEQKKYRIRGLKVWKAPKLCYLFYFKPLKFLLYFKEFKTE